MHRLSFSEAASHRHGYCDVDMVSDRRPLSALKAALSAASLTASSAVSRPLLKRPVASYSAATASVTQSPFGAPVASVGACSQEAAMDDSEQEQAEGQSNPDGPSRSLLKAPRTAFEHTHATMPPVSEYCSRDSSIGLRCADGRVDRLAGRAGPRCSEFFVCRSVQNARISVSQVYSTAREMHAVSVSGASETASWTCRSASASWSALAAAAAISWWQCPIR